MSRDTTPEFRESERNYSAARVLIGNCPQCERVLVVLNDGESWPLVYCPCGWCDATTALSGMRFEWGKAPAAHATGSGPATVTEVAPGGWNVTVLAHLNVKRKVHVADLATASRLAAERVEADLTTIGFAVVLAEGIDAEPL